MVPYMATIAELEDAGLLLPYDPDVEDGEFPSRYIHLAPDFKPWFEIHLPTESSPDRLHLTPYEQAEQKLYDFCMGRPLAYDRDRKILHPQGLHIWSLKAPEVRVFGWMPKRRHFIAVCGELKCRLQSSSDYTPFIERVREFREALPLDMPKFLTGVRPNDIC